MRTIVLKSGVVPSPGQITYNTAQTGLLIGTGRRLGRTANSAVPRIGSDKTTITLPKVSEAQLTGNLLRTRGLTAQGKTAHVIGFGMDSDLTINLPYADGKYTLQDNLAYAWEASLGRVGLDDLSRKTVAWSLMNAEEQEFVAAAWTTSAWTTSYASGDVTKWNDSASDPVDQVNTARRSILLASGMRANVMVMPRAVLDALVVHPRILRRISGGAGGTSLQMATSNQIAQLFEVEELVVVEYSSNAGTDLQEANKSMAFSVSDGVLFFARASNGEPRVINDAIVRYGWTALGGAEGVAVNTGHNDEESYQWWKLMRCAAYAVVNAGAGAFWADVL